MSALGHKRTCALRKAMSALALIATAKADFPKKSCLLYPQERTCAAHKLMSALGQKRTSRNRETVPKFNDPSEAGSYWRAGQLGKRGSQILPLAGLLSVSFSPALLVSKRIFEKVLVSFLKLILKAKDLKAIVSTDGPQL